MDLAFNASGTLDLEEEIGPLDMELGGNLGGDFTAYSLSSSGTVGNRLHGNYGFELDATGDLGRVDIDSLELESDSVDLTGSAKLDWRDELDAELVLAAVQLDPSAWLDEWPQSLLLSGQAVLTLADDLLQVSGLEIGNPEMDMFLHGSGSFGLQEEILSADIGWTGLNWPLNTPQPEIVSPSGRLRLDGRLDAWSALAEIEIEARDLPPGTLRAEGAGNSERADIKIIDGRVLGGEFAGLAHVDWGANGSWSAQVSASDIEAASITSGLLGSLNTRLEARGQAEPFGLELDILEFDSSYGDVPVTAIGRLRMDQSRLEFEELMVRAEDSRLEINGDAMGPQGLQFSASISELGIISANLGGAINADGRLSLAEADPWLEMGMRGESLELEGAPLLDQFSLLVSREPGGQSATFDAQVNGLDLSTSLAGGFAGTAKPFSQRTWRGNLKTLELEDDGQPYLSLVTPAELEVTAEKLALGPACLGAMQDSRACLEMDWKPGGLFSATAELEQASLKLVELFLTTGLEFSQVARGEIQWQTDFELPASGFASIQLSPGDIRLRDSSEILFRTGEGHVGFRLQDGRIFSGNFDLPLPGQGEIDLDFSVENLASGLESGLDGRLVINLADIDPIADVLPLLDRAAGRFTVDLQLSGTTGNPFFTGHMGLADGLLANDTIGLRLDDIQLAGEVLGNDETQLEGSFNTVKGSGRLQADLDLSQVFDPRLELNVEGEDLTLFDSPDLKLVASPDIRLEWRDDILGIHGKVLVPSARIAPRVMPQATVSQSPDLVVVAGEIPGSQAEAEEEETIAIRGNLEVTLGEKVHLDLDVAEAKIGGSVTFSWYDDLLPMANGSYGLEGEILAYGQLLQITRGNIGFPGVPADNPHLNVRAERRIYGNSEVRRAGLFVTGTLRRPVLEPYTDPATNRERAQTLLITGSDFNMETGVGAVDIGTYIAPRIWVSYGIGVFEDENVVSIRYDLGRNWGVKATSGQRQTGVDMSYTIDQ
jgi:translocation and assembly module TamB